MKVKLYKELSGKKFRIVAKCPTHYGCERMPEHVYSVAIQQKSFLGYESYGSRMIAYHDNGNYILDCFTPNGHKTYYGTTMDAICDIIWSEFEEKWLADNAEEVKRDKAALTGRNNFIQWAESKKK